MILDINVNDYKANKKDVDPFTKFYYSLISRAEIDYNKEKFAPDVTKFAVNPKDSEKLKVISDRWVKKQLFGFGEKTIETQRAMYWMNFSPKEDAKVQEGTVRFPKKCFARIN